MIMHEWLQEFSLLIARKFSVHHKGFLISLSKFFMMQMICAEVQKFLSFSLNIFK